ncbi:prephenate dehydrogenase [Fulvivirga sp. RKSG066]|uniref:prephenate dehydrogenase n=1 Tax=Fulvivirga aurantia TaxID=2529383 RepID=UPI0012BCC6CC|nr:prephenate dehydrogenase [Fulvivirga aurantia]MTI22109.1 prephenate dehydrogenase [Fulvivirga aurantia]
MIITVIGTGLIGGSMALDLKKRNIAQQIIGVDSNTEHIAKALELGIIDEVLDLKESAQKADLVIIAVPVDQAPSLLKEVLDHIKENAIVLDVGSIKANICKVADAHEKRSQFVACHPIAGTEYSGPEAAHYYLFDGKINIMTDVDKSSKSALKTATEVFEALKMKNIHMEAEEHDRHIAYVSHLSHITSFTLGLTVLDIEKDEKSIFNMAGSGFASTVRLAKSSPAMWTPIFNENKENLTSAIDSFIDKLNDLKQMIESGNTGETYRAIEESNQIKRILDGIELKNQAATLNN